MDWAFDSPMLDIVDFGYILSLWLAFFKVEPLGRNLVGSTKPEAPESTSILNCLSPIFMAARILFTWFSLLRRLPCFGAF